MQQKSRFLSKYVLHILILLTLVLLLRLPYLNLPLDRDEGGYAYVGWLWLSGKGIPYLSVFDHKPPMSFILFGLASLFGGNNFYSIRILALAYIMFFNLLFYYFALKLSSSLVAFLSSLLIIFYFASIRLEGSNFNIEMQMILPLLIFTFLIWKLNQKTGKRMLIAFCAGAVASIAVLFKQVALFPIAGLTLWFLLNKRKWLEVFILGIGFSVPVLMAIAYFWQHEALEDAYRGLVIYNQGYSREGLKQANIYIAGGATGLAGYINWITRIPHTILPFFLFSIGGLYFLRKKKKSVWWLGLILLSTFWLSAKMGGSREFPHYYLPLVLGMGFVFIFLVNTLIKKGKKLLVYVILIFLIGWVTLPELACWVGEPLEIQRKQFGIQGDWIYEAPLLAEWVSNNVASKESLLVWANEPELYYYASKKAHANYMHFYGFYHLLGEKEKWLENLNHDPPDWIITYLNDPGTYAELKDFLGISKDYEYSSTTKLFSYRLAKNTGSFLVLKKNEVKK